MTTRPHNPGTLVIRADSSFEIGAGHVMRCLALAQAWQDAGGSAIFAIAESTPAALSRLTAEGFEHVAMTSRVGSAEDADCTAALARSRQAKWIVLDGYKFDRDYQARVRNGDVRLAVIDDFGGADFAADLILNQNLSASQSLYPGRGRNAQLLLGTRFALLRREFAKWSGFDRPMPLLARGVLITMGGSDPGSFVDRILRSSGFTGFNTTFLVAGNTRDVVGASSSDISVMQNEPNMPAILSRSDISIICAGGTLWESLFMGCATLSYTRNEFQQRILQELDGMGAAHWLGDIENFNPGLLADAVNGIAASASKRKGMFTAGRQLIDGCGATRVVRSLQDAIVNL